MIEMTHKFFTLLVSVLCVFSAHSFAYAQDKAKCGIEYEVIFQLDVPPTGSYAVWNTAWGDREETEFLERGVVRRDGMVFMVGRRAPKDLRPERLLFAQTRRGGRLHWHKEHALPGLLSIAKVIRRDDGSYIVLANMVGENKKEEFAWIGFVDMEGVVTGETTLKHKSGRLKAQDIIMMPKRDSKAEQRYLLSAAAPARAVGTEDGDGSLKLSTVLYVLNDKGQAVSKRSLIMGAGNQILQLARLEATKTEPAGYLGTGFVYDVHKRKMGWVARLDDKGAIMWQQQYPRGAGSQLVSGLPLRSDAFAVAGTASPLIRDGKRAAWVMVVKRDNGNVLWQRYFTGEPEFFGRDLLISSGGLVSVLIDGDILYGEDGKMPEKKEKEAAESVVVFDDLSGLGHVRLMTLDPRGSLHRGEAYYNDNGVNAYQLLRGPGGDRVMVGGTNAVYRDEQADSEEMTSFESMDGWFAAAIPEPEYEDPCLPKPYRAP